MSSTGVPSSRSTPHGERQRKLVDVRKLQRRERELRGRWRASRKHPALHLCTQPASQPSQTRKRGGERKEKEEVRWEEVSSWE